MNVQERMRGTYRAGVNSRHWKVLDRPHET